MARKDRSIPQNPSQIKQKIVRKTEGEPLPAKAREVVEETGREVSGDYERQQEEQALESPPRVVRPKRATP